MLIVAERINSSRKPIFQAIEAKDGDFIRSEARAQAKAGAHYIGVNAGSFPEREAEYLCWLVEIVQEATELPICIDSPNPEAVAAAMEVLRRPTMINSVSPEEKRLAGMLPLVKKHKAKVVALCEEGASHVPSAEDKVRVAGQLIKTLTQEGIPLDDIYIDPLVYPLATDTRSALSTLNAIEAIMRSFPGVHTICAISNVSFGLPLRRLLNRTFLVAAMFHGLGATILDPTDRELMASIVAAETLLGKDEYCLKYIEAYQKGTLG